MKRHILAGLAGLAALAADIVTKQLIVNNLSYYDKIDFLDGFFRITLVYNRGGVFGILQGYKNMFLVFSLIVLLIMIGYYIYERNKPLLHLLALACIISGAVGNIIDRLVPDRPGVVDFISIGVDGVYRWPAFNIADSVIVVGAALLVLMLYREEKALKNGPDA
jgi:signal peptidase II